jgi:hypothetical protein
MRRCERFRSANITQVISGRRFGRIATGCHGDRRLEELDRGVALGDLRAPMINLRCRGSDNDRFRVG